MVYGLIHQENYNLEWELLEESLKKGQIHLVLYGESRNPEKPKTYV